MKKYISMIAASLMAVSCVDTIILPDNMTVEEDFWKSKSDVQLMVSGAYQSMLSGDIQTRLLVWSGLRSDELVPTNTPTNALVEDLTEICLANIQEDNTFATWGAFYNVINNCNIVLEKAGQVIAEDPSYTEGDYLADCSKMLALRALCYFHLVRNFRDVPFVGEAFMSSSQNRNIAQSAPAEILDRLIQDLETAERNAVASNAYGNWQDVGFFTRDGIQALMADIYLWRGSVMHNASDYAKCIEYCNQIIASKKTNHVGNRFQKEDESNPYPSLAEGREMFNDLFVDQNSEESIFELQFNGRNNGNLALCQYYNSYANNRNPYVYAAAHYAYGATSNPVYATNDWRSANTYYPEVAAGSFTGREIRKFVSENSDFPTLDQAAKQAKVRTYTENYAQNFIVYRLADVMLMKAEALVGSVLLSEQTEEDTRLHEAFNMVNAVNARALVNAVDSMTWDNIDKTAADIDKLVLKERQRELAFEGKRWYDLLRYTYRNMEASAYAKVNYNAILADQADYASVENNSVMLTEIKTKLSGQGEAVVTKLRTEPSWYMPIPLSDLKISPLLKQNPNYGSKDSSSKNY